MNAPLIAPSARAENALFLNVIRDTRLSSRARLLAAVVASGAAPQPPRNADLMRLCGFRTRFTLIEARNELERGGYIRVVRRNRRIDAILLVKEGVQ